MKQSPATIIAVLPDSWLKIEIDASEMSKTGQGKWKDPYDFVDGPGIFPGGGYGHATVTSLIGYSVLMKYLPALKDIEPHADLVDDFTTRVTTGAEALCQGAKEWVYFHAQGVPDDCAPPSVADQRAGCNP